MANTAQARKRARQIDRRRALKASQRSRMRTAIKKALGAILAGDKDGARNACQEAVSLADKAAGKGLIHKNKAARVKQRLNARLRALG